MFKALGKLIFGSVNDRAVKSLSKIVTQVNALEQGMLALSDSELTAQTVKLKHKLSEGFSLDDILPEAFATVREASRRVLNMRHFDVQILGGVVLHRGMIAEMRTGEGKTLVATLAVYLNALTEKGVHLVTVNDYLVKRDAEWMGKIYKFLGLSIGCITHELNDEQRREAYNCDITYGTNNEVGFDYLRDNMKHNVEHLSQRKFNFAIVDEVDSVLVDEARTPLVISGPAEDSSALYVTINKLVPQLKETDYEVDEKSRQVTLTEDGMSNVEDILKKHKLIEEDIAQGRAWGEVSDKMEHVIIKRGGTPIPNIYASKLTKKDILQYNPDGYHYTRLINGAPHEKIIFAYEGFISDKNLD